jgi:hypothetical protein
LNINAFERLNGTKMPLYPLELKPWSISHINRSLLD